MRSVISNLEKTIKALQKEKAKFEKQFRENKDGFSYGRCIELADAIADISHCIDKVKNHIDIDPA